MKNIKYFKYKNTCNFEDFLSAYEYKLEDVKGFKFIGKKQYQGNILKVYFICLNDGEEVYFTVAYFKDFNEYNSVRLGFKGDKLLEWYDDAVVRAYKLKEKNEYVIAK